MANAVLLIDENLLFQKIKHNHAPPTLEARVNVLRHKILGAKYLGFFSSRSLKAREVSFAQLVYFLREVCLLFKF